MQFEWKLRSDRIESVQYTQHPLTHACKQSHKRAKHKQKLDWNTWTCENIPINFNLLTLVGEKLNYELENAGWLNIGALDEPRMNLNYIEKKKDENWNGKDEKKHQNENRRSKVITMKKQEWKKNLAIKASRQLFRISKLFFLQKKPQKRMNGRTIIFIQLGTKQNQLMYVWFFLYYPFLYLKSNFTIIFKWN